MVRLWPAGRCSVSGRVVALVMSMLCIGIYIASTFHEAGREWIPIEDPVQCNDTLDKPASDNARIVRNYPLGDSKPYLEDLGLVEMGRISKKPKDLPVVVTSASSNHFAESLYMLKRLYRDVFREVGNLTVIYYDMGLSSWQHNKIKTVFGCEMRYFPFEKFPPHVRTLTGFAWKPIIIQTVLNEHGFVMWMDASVKITNGYLLPAFQKARKHGIVLSFSGASYSLAESTDRRTFRMLGEEPCVFRSVKELYATFIIIHTSDHLLSHIMRPWLSCALTDGCMQVPRDSEEGCSGSKHVYGGCHRFDQSVLSIILHRLHHDSLPDITFGEALHWMKCSNRLTSWWWLPNSINERIFEIMSSGLCH